MAESRKNRKAGNPSVRWIGSLLIGGLILMTLLLGLEVFFRFQPRFARTVLAFDQETLWRLKKGHTARKLYGQGEKQSYFTLKLNNRGFRGASFQKKKKEGTIRIMILGDSYTAGLDYPLEETFSKQLEQGLNKSLSNRVEVLNASCPAWGTDQEYLYWKSEGKFYQPDYLVLMVAPNDLREAYNKGLLELDEARDLTTHPIEMPFKKRIGWNLATKSALFQYLQQQVFLTKYGNFFDIYADYPVHFGKEDATNWDLPTFLKEPFPEVETSEQLFETLINEVKESTEAIQSQLILSVIPSKMEFDGTLKDTIYQPGKVANLLEEIAVKKDIPFLNLLEKLDSQPDPLSVYIQDEFHLNSEGHRFVAEHLLPFFEVLLKE